MKPLQLHVLGAPCVSYAGQHLVFRSRRALALLIYLAVEPGFHTRDHLASLLWPDSEQTHSRMLLRSAIALLRQSLSAVGFASTDALVLEQDRVLLDPTAIELDLMVLKQAEQSHERAVGGTSTAEAARLVRLQEAVRAYQGDFLRGFSLLDAPMFEDWASVQREHFHRRMHPIFAQLVAHLHARGELGSAIEAATRWVAHDPLHEAAHEHRIRLALEAGDRAEALNAYQRYCTVLEIELGIAPNPAIQTLVEQLHVPGAATLARPAAHGEQVFNSVARTGTLWQRIAESYRAVRQGSAHILVLERHATSSQEFSCELSQWATAEGADLILGEAYNLGGRVPYQVVGDALRRRIDQERAPDDLLPDVWLTEISRLVPDLRDRYPDLPAPISDEATSAVRLYEAVAHLTRAISHQRPVVVWIDNAHWADDASLDLLHYIARRWAATGVPALLIYTVEAEANSSYERHTPGLAQSLAQLDHKVPVTFVSQQVPALSMVRQSSYALAA